MNIGLIAGYTSIAGVEQGYLGLPVRQTMVNDTVNGPDTPAIQTAWLPTPEEAMELHKGCPIIVTTLGTGIVPIMLSVGDHPVLSLADALANEIRAGKEAADKPLDGRPEGWTEALALTFIAENAEQENIGLFACAFNEGAWDEVDAEWPSFRTFAKARS